MRRLLIALATAGVVMAGPAVAVDYVKCEAIQNAYARLKASAQQAEKDVWREVLAKYEQRDCGDSPSPMQAGYSTKKSLDHSSCTMAAYGRNYDLMKKETASDPRVASPNDRAAKVRADYLKAGCF